jgi:ElaB/YqjD/DUF883 family membrane-anchored ribosome-binding protein
MWRAEFPAEGFMRYINADRLVRDLRAVGADIDEMVKATEGNAAEAIVAARERIVCSLRAVKDNLEDSGRHVMGQTKYAAKSTNRYMHDNVWKIMGIAGAVGILAGTLLSHRGESAGPRRD